ncbi:hypothetical protein [Pelagicoccus mobilis]|uniref:DUF3352 domain-containing protein n=1 Tax=Pelagicoccus mobilis TaxID=415221 RepID=A0A934S6S8_9BACT|nr:hypothetical protein [Pelagicoccus mobilis]MBK1880419.1 hypothetical protein [Pelagicoccus mobilis]
MNPNTFKKLSVAALALGASAISLQAGSFKEMSGHLDLDGDFVGYMDFDGEGKVLGDKLNVIYQQFADSNPNVPPFPIDFPAIFETLGFGSVRSMGMSSTEVEQGLHRNRSVTLLEGDPAGLFGVYSLDKIGFRAAKIAPADASTVISGRFDFDAIVSTAQSLASTIMGPMGEGMVMQGLGQPVADTDITVGELVSALSGGMDLIVVQNMENPAAPDIKGYLALKGAGGLVERLEPMMTQMGVQFSDTDKGRVADLSMFLQGAPIGLFVEVSSDSNDLLIYTDSEWVKTLGTGEGLVDSAAYQRVAGRLPEDAAFYAYSSGVEVDQLVGLLEQNPEMAAFAPLIANAVESLLGGFLAPSASATYREGDALITEGYSGFSYKDAVAVLPVGIAGGVGIAAAAEKMKKAQSWSGGSADGGTSEGAGEDSE